MVAAWCLLSNLSTIFFRFEPRRDRRSRRHHRQARLSELRFRGLPEQAGLAFVFESEAFAIDAHDDRMVKDPIERPGSRPLSAPKTPESNPRANNRFMVTFGFGCFPIKHPVAWRRANESLDNSTRNEQTPKRVCLTRHRATDVVAQTWQGMARGSDLAGVAKAFSRPPFF